MSEESTRYETALRALALELDPEAELPLDSVSCHTEAGRNETVFSVRWESDPRALNIGGVGGLALGSIAALWSHPSGRFRVEHVADGVYEANSRRPERIRGVDRTNAKEWLRAAPEAVRQMVSGSVPDLAAA